MRHHLPTLAFADAPPEAVQEQRVERAGEAADVPEAADAEVRGTTVAGASVVDLRQELPVAEMEDRVAELATDPAVVRAEPDHRVVGHGLPNDRLYRRQWSLPVAQTLAGWSAATGKGTVIGVIDSGITDHRDLSSKVVGGYDFLAGPSGTHDGDGRDPDCSDPGTYGPALHCGTGYDVGSNWHGTHVAGVAAAVTDNEVDVAGIAPDAQLLIGRVLGECGYISEVADAVLWMSGARGARRPGGR